MSSSGLLISSTPEPPGEPGTSPTDLTYFKFIDRGWMHLLKTAAPNLKIGSYLSSSFRNV
jgi:hypothetical protein